MSGSEDRPTGLIAQKGLELLTFGTPNGHKVSILLEELKEKYGKDYVFQSINIGQNIQKEDWFTKLGPNGRIPVLVDHDRKDFAVFEGLAILAYLVRHYDPDQHFTFADADEYSVAEQWMAWQHGGLGPMQGQANHFYRLAKERIPYPTQRYVGESERLWSVLNIRLEGRDYVAGPDKGKYSIADISCFSWANFGYFAGVDVTMFPNVERWLKRINERPAVKKGTAVPSESGAVNEAFLRRMKDPNEKEFQEQNQKLQQLLKEAKEKYEYKFAPV